MGSYDFSGWATRANIKCSDGRTIMRGAFAHHDGEVVPLVWNHQHNNPENVLGHALLENRDEGVYAYCTFNDTESGKMARELVKHGDVTALSIYANQLRQQKGNVLHGNIREVSLVLAGANPGAFIEAQSIRHGDEFVELEDEAVVYSGENIELFHAEEAKEPEETKEESKEEEKKEMANEKTVKDVFDELTEEQKTVVYAMIGQALEDAGANDEEDEKVKHNVFDQDEMYQENVLSHADQAAILSMAKQTGVGSLKAALEMFMGETMMHADGGTMYGEGVIESLFPEYELLKPGAPELLERDQSWVGHVMKGTHKSPISRIRTRQADARVADLRAHGYQNKGDQKHLAGQIKMLTRTTDPQTVYRKDMMHRDDIIDITDFDVVAYQWNIMRRNLEEEIAQAILIGDGREDGDPDKIHQEHIRSIWNDEELYTIHADVDIEGMKEKLQGTDTGVYFGDEYVYAEAIISAALYSREKYKGSGALEFYCTPHLLNVMLLARDRNGHRMYSSQSDLAAALNVKAIHTVEQFEGKVRTDKTGGKHKLLGLFVNLSDYQIGATKGGEITKFDQFDIDFNQYKYLIETRISGALTKPFAAIALEEPVVGE